MGQVATESWWKTRCEEASNSSSRSENRGAVRTVTLLRFTDAQAPDQLALHNRWPQERFYVTCWHWKSQYTVIP